MWFELVMVALLSAAPVLFVSHYYLIPSRTEIWVDMSTARVEHHTYILNLGTDISVKEYCADVATRYAALDPRQKFEPNWQPCLTTYDWFRFDIHEQQTHYELLSALMSMGGIVRPYDENDAKLDKAAVDELVLRFMLLMQTQADPEIVADYYWANIMKAEELEHTATVEDLIPLDLWLEDPDVLHYIEPKRLY